MRLITPNSLHYPITVTKLLRAPRDQIDRNAPLFTYLYKHTVIEGSVDNKEGRPVERTWPSTFESYGEGELSQWMIQEGMVITRPGTAIAEIEEPCKHEVQFGGMCAECGKDMTTVAYNTVTRDTARATVNAVHGHTALLVSKAEASKEDEEAKRRLLSSRKLSLVVDLDQTIIHATVDPTVAEWQNDVNNPNHHAVKDVRAFQLIDDGPGARGCWYYIKLRPGLEDFLATISKYFELHIYTMGTRAYAQNIAKIVDPERKIFADRILSRDESGSMTAKNLKRLFPVDTKMVVIIDDRGDVWHWSQNLIKVTPYDFFVGIGDINSSFLPKRPELEVKPSKQVAPADALATQDDAVAPAPAENGSSETTADTPMATPKPQTEPLADPSISAIDQLVSMGGGNDPNKLQEQTSEQDETIAAQLADRPLLRKQKMLDAVEDDNNATAETKSQDVDDVSDDTAAESQQKYRHNLLQDNDKELRYLQQSLQSVHAAFFQEYDGKLATSQGGRVADLRPQSQKKRSLEELEQLPDVTTIMATMKQKVLKGVHLVFSGIMPLGVDVQSHDLAIWAKSFGATVSENIKKRTTHVIASPQRRTAKVRQAAKKPDRISIVTQDWLFDSLSQWQRVSEDPYRIHSEVAENGEKPTELGGSTPFDGPDENTALSSSDDEAALTDEESETPNGSGTEGDAQERAELAQYMPSLSREDSSLHEETNEDWEGMNDELADFLGSDADEDSESDMESIKSVDSASTELPFSSAKKRKRGGENGEAAATATEDEDSDASQSGGSKLQRRKIRALARTTSLTNVAAVVDSATPEPAGRGHQVPDTLEEEDEEEVEEDSDADLEAQLEAEMLRQSEEEEEEEQEEQEEEKEKGQEGGLKGDGDD